jgi:hypothetical protein
MQLLEFQAKQVFKEYGITVRSGRLCTTVDDAVRNYDEIGGYSDLDSFVIGLQQIHFSGSIIRECAFPIQRSLNRLRENCPQEKNW